MAMLHHAATIHFDLRAGPILLTWKGKAASSGHMPRCGVSKILLECRSALADRFPGGKVSVLFVRGLDEIFNNHVNFLLCRSASETETDCPHASFRRNLHGFEYRRQFDGAGMAG